MIYDSVGSVLLTSFSKVLVILLYCAYLSTFQYTLSFYPRCQLSYCGDISVSWKAIRPLIGTHNQLVLQRSWLSALHIENMTERLCFVVA
jgi:hypothetical protein